MERCFADEDQRVENNMGYGLVSGGYRTREQLWEGWVMLNMRLPPAWEGCTKLAQPCPAFATVGLPSGHRPPRSFAGRAGQGKEMHLLSRSGKGMAHSEEGETLPVLLGGMVSKGSGWQLSQSSGPGVSEQLAVVLAR